MCVYASAVQILLRQSASQQHLKVQKMKVVELWDYMGHIGAIWQPVISFFFFGPMLYNGHFLPFLNIFGKARQHTANKDDNNNKKKKKKEVEKKDRKGNWGIQ